MNAKRNVSSAWLRFVLIFTVLTALLIINHLLKYTFRQEGENSFTAHIPEGLQRVWIGPEFWANPLQDWQIRDGKIECLRSGKNRNVFLLTREVGKGNGSFQSTVQFGINNRNSRNINIDWVGFRVGIKGQFQDYRDSAVRGKGIDVGITTTGQLFVGEPVVTLLKIPLVPVSLIGEGVTLKLDCSQNDGQVSIKISAIDPRSSEVVSVAEKKFASTVDLAGGISLVSDLSGAETEEKRLVVWFRDWQLFGDLILSKDERSYGPVLFNQYTLSRNILKMAVQLPPMGGKDGTSVWLEIEKNGKFYHVAEGKVDADSWNSLLRVPNWDSSKKVSYKLGYKIYKGNNEFQTYYYGGTIQKEPREKDEIVMAALSCNYDLGFPHQDLVENVSAHNPDLLFFAGDQIYEGIGGYGVTVSPLGMAKLDYLRKWYMFGWSFRELMRNRPTITIPDDHDVFHGNLWGEGGGAAQRNGDKFERQDSGGYKMPPEWVKMVEKTQVSHLPDPYDPLPVKQGIGVYFTEMQYGGISFAIIEDRKFKSAPKPLFSEAEIWNGWALNENWDVRTQSDTPSATLLGERQLQFLDGWVRNWKENVWYKVLLSQTIFNCLVTLPWELKTDQSSPELEVFSEGEYPQGDTVMANMESNGWPQAGRNKAIRIMRRGFALHIAGDQHLGSVVQYGVDDWRDAGFAFCTPAISNVWPRRWFPPKVEGGNIGSNPQYTGDLYDGFGNKMTVQAIANPRKTGKSPSKLYDRAPGYGIIKFIRKTRKVEMTCWPRDEDILSDEAMPYKGWPIIVSQEDNYGRKAVGYLPTIKIIGGKNPVVTIIDQVSNEHIYTLRIQGNKFSPRIFKHGKYRIIVEFADGENEKIVFENISSTTLKGSRILNVQR